MVSTGGEEAAATATAAAAAAAAAVAAATSPVVSPSAVSPSAVSPRMLMFPAEAAEAADAAEAAEAATETKTTATTKQGQTLGGGPPTPVDGAVTPGAWRKGRVTGIAEGSITVMCGGVQVVVPRAQLRKTPSGASSAEMPGEVLRVSERVPREESMKASSEELAAAPAEATEGGSKNKPATSTSGKTREEEAPGEQAAIDDHGDRGSSGGRSDRGDHGVWRQARVIGKGEDGESVTLQLYHDEAWQEVKVQTRPRMPPDDTSSTATESGGAMAGKSVETTKVAAAGEGDEGAGEGAFVESKGEAKEARADKEARVADKKTGESKRETKKNGVVAGAVAVASAVASVANI